MMLRSAKFPGRTLSSFAPFLLLAGFSSPHLPAQTAAPRATPANASTKEPKSISEEDLRQQLLGKRFYLRAGYTDNTLHFDERGQLNTASPKGPYTLSLIQIDRVHLSGHRLELQGIRYGVHFLDEGASEDALANADKVRITPKKKSVTITIERARVEKPKKIKAPKHKKGDPPAAAETTTITLTPPLPPPGTAVDQARANEELRSAIHSVFSAGLDQDMVAALPDYWRTYFQTIAKGGEFKPSNPAVLRQSAVDRKARLLSTFEPPSNDFAQKAGVIGIAQYHVVVGPDGRAGEISVGRPIGFGLDENAVDTIRKATFEPALKDGKPVPVVLDMLVQFRIYSQRTASARSGTALTEAQPSPTLPGPYSGRQPADAPK